MKYLKTYESNRRKGPIQLDIEDIFIELVDNGFKVDCNFFSQGQSISIDIKKHRFAILDILDDLERSIEYLSNKGWKFQRFKIDDWQNWVDSSDLHNAIQSPRGKVTSYKFSMIFSRNS